MVVEKVYQASRGFRLAEVLFEASGQFADQLAVGVDHCAAGLAGGEKVVGEHCPVPGGDGFDLVLAVAVEGDERQGLLRPPLSCRVRALAYRRAWNDRASAARRHGEGRKGGVDQGLRVLVVVSACYYGMTGASSPPGGSEAGVKS